MYKTRETKGSPHEALNVPKCTMWVTDMTKTDCFTTTDVHMEEDSCDSIRFIIKLISNLET